MSPVPPRPRLGSWSASPHWRGRRRSPPRSRRSAPSSFSYGPRCASPTATEFSPAALDLGLIDGYAAPSDPLRLPDAGLADPSAGGVGTVAIAESPVVVAMPATHPLARRPGLALPDLAEAYWIDAPAVAPLAELRAAAGLDGLGAGLRYEGADVAVLTSLVAAGHGLALLPHSVVSVASGLVGVPLSAPRLVHRIELLNAGASAGDGPAARLAAALMR